MRIGIIHTGSVVACKTCIQKEINEIIQRGTDMLKRARSTQANLYTTPRDLRR